MVAELAMLVEMVHASDDSSRKDQVKALRLTREKMHELMQEDPSLATHFSSHILKRLQLLAEDLERRRRIDCGFSAELSATPSIKEAARTPRDSTNAKSATAKRLSNREQRP